MGRLKYILFLICLILVVTLIACSNNTDTDSNNNGVTVANNIEDLAPPEEIELKPDLPEKDMNGKIFNILAARWYGYEPMNVTDISPEELTGEILNDAAYNRKINIETQYNCQIIHIETYEDDPGAIVQRIRRSVAAGDNACDIALIRGINFTSLMTGGGYLHELDTLPYIDFDMPWWNRKAYDALAVGGKRFGVCGSISTNEMMSVWTVCFNKNMIKDHGMESPYDLVKSGDWTFDKSVEMAKAVARDLNGDGIMDIDDLRGINYTSDTIMGILNASEVTIAALDSQGTPQITLNSQINLSKIQNIFTQLFDENYSVNTMDYDLAGLDGKIFADERCLLLFTATHLVGALRQMDTDFGIVPYPKYNKEQAEYVPNTAGIFLPIVCVPKTNMDSENTGLFLEAFAYEGSKTIVPAFYENILMGKTARDDESAAMLEYIYGNIRYDTGNLFNLGDFHGVIRNMAANKNTNIASALERNIPVMETAIDKLLNDIIN